MTALLEACLGTFGASHASSPSNRRQKQFVDLGGEATKNGNLKSVVVHSIEAKSMHSTFPIALGSKISGVEEKTFSSIGAPYSMVVLPNAKKEAPVKLQEDDVSVGAPAATTPPTP